MRSIQICQYTPYEKVQYQIRAMNNAGSSNTSTTDEIRTLCAASSAPHSVSFGDPITTQQAGRERLMYTVNWQKPLKENCESISFYNTRYPASDSNITPRTVASRNVYADGDTVVEFHVTAVNNDKLESAAAVISITTLEIRPQLYPTSVSSMVNNSTCITLSWQPPRWPNGPITGYQYKCNDEDSWTDIENSADKREYQLCQFSPYQIVECKLRAVNSAGNSNSATAPSVTTDCDVPTLPPNLLKYITETSYKPKESEYHRRRIIMHIPKKDILANCREITLRQYKLNGSVDYTLNDQPLADLNAVTNYVIVYSAANDEGFIITGSVVVSTGELEPGPVRVLMEPFNLSCISLSWTEPQPPNGIITEYQYRCRAPNSPNPSYTTTRERRDLVLCNYQSGDLVTCEVRASTAIGYGPASINETKVSCGDPGKAVVFVDQTVVYSAELQKELVNVNITWMAVISNCRNIVNYSVSLSYREEVVKDKTAEADGRALSMEGLYPFTNYTVQIIATNNEGLTSHSFYTLITQETAPTDPPSLVLNFSSFCVELFIRPPNSPNGLIMDYTYSCQYSHQPLWSSTNFTVDTSKITRGSFPELCEFEAASKVTCSVYASNIAGDSQSSYDTGYTHLQLKNTSITSTDHVVVFSKVMKGFYHTSIILKPIDLMNVIRNQSNYQLIIGNIKEPTRSRQKRKAVFKNSTCDADSLYGYEKAAERGLPCYITAEIPGSLVTDDGLIVNIGDGQTLNNYYNAPLEPETNYSLVVGLIVYFEIILGARMLDTTESKPTSNQKSLTIGVSVGVVMAAAAVGIGIYCIKRGKNLEIGKSTEIESVSLQEGSSPKALTTGAEYASMSSNPDDDHAYDICRSSRTYEDITLYENIVLSPVYEEFASEEQKLMSAVPVTIFSLFIENNQALISQQFKELKNSGNHSVTLLRLEGDEDEDKDEESSDHYIDATLLKGFNEDTRYIASKGPTQATINDFWRMVWQEKTQTIVTLTNETGLKGVSSVPYIPQTLGSTETCHHFKIVLLASNHKARYVMRTLKLYKNREARILKQFEFQFSGDLSSPAEMSLFIDLARKVRTLHADDDCPLLVHCSQEAKIGLYIGLSTLLEEASSQECVNVAKCVEKIRKRRPQLIKTEREYRVLYETLNEALKNEAYVCKRESLKTKLETKMDIIAEEYQTV
ncbi:receptor-type tyrosine-protein phosphatase U-like [Watersipora subatra]|uniref:receptor-type tyrosine-protein phosphatase U-like n=1 Tax=Watersipora subatra TaxID=2589382 RepID=UPI00355C6CCB